MLGCLAVVSSTYSRSARGSLRAETGDRSRISMRWDTKSSISSRRSSTTHTNTNRRPYHRQTSRQCNVYFCSYYSSQPQDISQTKNTVWVVQDAQHRLIFRSPWVSIKSAWAGQKQWLPPVPKSVSIFWHALKATNGRIQTLWAWWTARLIAKNWCGDGVVIHEGTNL